MGVHNLAKMLDGFEDKTATAQTTLALWNGRDEPLLFTGSTDGKLVCPRGPQAFGWYVGQEHTTLLSSAIECLRYSG